MFKGFIKLCYENFISVHFSTKQHENLIPFWEEHFLFNNIQGCKRGTAYTDAVLSDILDIEGGSAVPNVDMTYNII